MLGETIGRDGKRHWSLDYFIEKEKHKTIERYV
jgi:hypothetical protein